jgi:malate dehydrogenase (oxaloacetate-decarboxylating)(NADP+)
VELRTAALEYHEQPVPGKIAIAATKQLTNQRDLALAYSPGVAAPCEEIVKDPNAAFRYTARGNLVGVVTNGTAVLGLGDIGPLASKPVMEGKGVLFKKFSGIDVFDIEINEKDPDKLVDIIASLEPTFGGINLEDIKAPECFEIEEALIARCDIPVFHDDQHGTAIVTAAGLLNALEVQGKRIEQSRIVCMGAGAAATACMDLLIKCGAAPHNIFMLDRQGVIHTGRTDLNRYKQRFANDTPLRTLMDVIEGADVFVGVSGPDVLPAEAVALMAPNPVIFACSNPDPEIKPSLAHSVRDDLIMGTGRSDYPNQINNVLCFPFIFRGALDARASRINDAMKIAAVEAIRGLVKEPVPAEVLTAAGVSGLAFGKDYVIPKPMDARLLPRVARAVALAAVASGVARVALPADYMLE